MFRIDALIREIETLSEGRLTSTPLCGAENVTVRTFAPLNHAAADTVAFLAQSKYRDEAKASQAGVLVISQADSEVMYGEEGPKRPVVITKNPYAWFAYALQIMTRRPLARRRIREGAHVDPTAKVAASAVIEAGATVAAGAVIGETRAFIRAPTSVKARWWVTTRSSTPTRLSTTAAASAIASFFTRAA